MREGTAAGTGADGSGRGVQKPSLSVVSFFAHLVVVCREFAKTTTTTTKQLRRTLMKTPTTDNALYGEIGQVREYSFETRGKLSAITQRRTLVSHFRTGAAAAAARCRFLLFTFSSLSSPARDSQKRRRGCAIQVENRPLACDPCTVAKNNPHLPVGYFSASLDPDPKSVCYPA